MCTKTELMLDISHNPVDHEQFSWSKEMERSYVEHQKNQDQLKMETDERLVDNESPSAGSDDSEVS